MINGVPATCNEERACRAGRQRREKAYRQQRRGCGKRTQCNGAKSAAWGAAQREEKSAGKRRGSVTAGSAGAMLATV